MLLVSAIFVNTGRIGRSHFGLKQTAVFLRTQLLERGVNHLILWNWHVCVHREPLLATGNTSEIIARFSALIES